MNYTAIYLNYKSLREVKYAMTSTHQSKVGKHLREE